MLPRTGDVLRVTRRASVQFTTPILFRVIRIHDWPTYDGWIWLDGYELDAAGDAVLRRSIFVQIQGIQHATVGPARNRYRAPRPAVPPRRPVEPSAGSPIRPERGNTAR